MGRVFFNAKNPSKNHILDSTVHAQVCSTYGIMIYSLKRRGLNPHDVLNFKILLNLPVLRRLYKNCNYPNEKHGFEILGLALELSSSLHSQSEAATLYFIYIQIYKVYFILKHISFFKKNLRTF